MQIIGDDVNYTKAILNDDSIKYKKYFGNSTNRSCD